MGLFANLTSQPSVPLLQSGIPIPCRVKGVRGLIHFLPFERDFV